MPEMLAPPSDLDAEKALIGSLLLHAAGRPDLTVVSREDFYRSGNALIYDSLADLSERGEPVDAVTLRANLTAAGTLEQAGGADYLLDCVNSVPHPENAEFYASIVRQKSSLRAYLRLGHDLTRLSMEPGADAQVIGEHAEKGLLSIKQGASRRDAARLSDVAGPVTARLLLPPDQRQGGVRTGFIALDSLTGGMHPGEFTILAARPSQGKTTLALRVAENVGQERPVLIFSLEMVRDTLAQNMIVSMARIDSHRARTSRLDQDETGRLLDTAQRIAGTQVWIDDSADVTVSEIRARARRFALANPLGLVIVDYLQLIGGGRTDKYDGRQNEVSAISRGMKQLASELRVPVMALSQLNRQVEARADHRPMLSDLRESGSLEQDADCVLLLHRPGSYAGSDEPEGKAILQLAKNRNGKVAEVELVFLPAYMRFENRASFSEGA